MSERNPTGGGKSPLSLLIWGLLAAALAGGAYLAGADLAKRWLAPSLAFPLPAETQIPTSVPTQVSTRTAALRLTPGDPAEGTLGEHTVDEWQFQGLAGQSATVEMWLHPGSGSSVEAELVARLVAPDGTVLVEETGSVFLPPYLFEPNLPTTDLYSVQVSPAAGAPGRYSLLLTFSEASGVSTPGAPLPQRPTAMAASGSAATASPGQFLWPAPQRRISGWTFHDPANPGHIGLDIGADMWDPIVAAADGVVVFAEWGGGYGNLVVVEHEGGWLTYYAHFSEIVVDVGQEVRQGELLGGAGTTGYSTGPHLHFEIRYQGRPVDPHVYLQ
jgi:murein DD-endopeptidase MepM/ murein hydrolase activator NlpD